MAENKREQRLPGTTAKRDDGHVIVSVRMQRDLYEKTRYLARRENTSISAIVRRMIVFTINEEIQRMEEKASTE